VRLPEPLHGRTLAWVIATPTGEVTAGVRDNRSAAYAFAALAQYLIDDPLTPPPMRAIALRAQMAMEGKNLDDTPTYHGKESA